MSKLALAITNSEVDAGAAIAMSKLALAITNSEVDAGAAIDYSKINVPSLAIIRAKLANGIIDETKLNTGAVTTAKLDYNGGANPGSGDKGKAIIVNESDETKFAFTDFPAGLVRLQLPKHHSNPATWSSWTCQTYIEISTTAHFVYFVGIASELDFTENRTLKIAFAWSVTESTARDCYVMVDARAEGESLSGSTPNINDADVEFPTGNGLEMAIASLTITGGSIVEGDRIAIKIWRKNKAGSIDGSYSTRILNCWIE